MSEVVTRVILVASQMDERNIHILKKYLTEDEGYDIVSVSSTEALLHLLEKLNGTQSVIALNGSIIDTLTNLATLKGIKSRNPNIEVIIFDATDSDTEREFADAGALAFLRHPFSYDHLALTIKYASQRHQGITERSMLSVLQQVSAAMNSSLDIYEILRETCRAATDFLKVDHSGVVEFNPDLKGGKVIAEYPDGRGIGIKRKVLGTFIPVQNVPAEEELIFKKKVLNIPDVSKEESLGPVQAILLGFDILSTLFVPVIVGGNVVASFSLDSIGKQRRFSQNEIEFSKNLANQAAIAIEKAHSINRLQAFYEAEKKLVFMADNEEDVLQRIVDSALSIFPLAQRGSIHIFNQRSGKLELATPTHPFSSETAVALSLDPNEGIAGWVYKNDKPLVVNDAALDTRYKRVHHPEVPPHKAMMCTPLRINGSTLGVLCLSNFDVPNVFREGDVELFDAFADHAATAIYNTRLFASEMHRRKEADSLRAAALALMSTTDLAEIIDQILKQLRRIVAFDTASVQLLRGDRLEIIGGEGFPNLTEIIGCNFLLAAENPNRDVIRIRKPVILPDAPSLYKGFREEPHSLANIHSWLGVPMLTGDRIIGMIALDMHKPGFYTAEHSDIALAFAAQAGAAIANSRRIFELTHLRKAAEALAHTTDLEDVLKQIVRNAREVLQADSALIMPYDDNQGAFLLDETVADGIEPQLIEQFRQEEPRPKGTAETVKTRRYLAVTDINDQRFAYLGTSTRGLRSAAGIIAFQGITLRYGGETLGVLYVNYNYPRGFGDDDRVVIETLGRYASIALKNGRLLQQTENISRAAQVVAGVTVKEELNHTLQAIVKLTCKVIGCDIVTIYPFDEEKNRFGLLIQDGAKHPEIAREPKNLEQAPAIREIIQLEDPPFLYCDNRTTNHPLLSGRFAQAERVQAAFGCLLKAGGHKVGVMFVDYRSYKKFKSHEITIIQFFANQAAVAIRNSQLYHDTKRKSELLQALYRTVTSSRPLEETLSLIAEQSIKLSGSYGKVARYSLVALVEGGFLRYKVTWPINHLIRLRKAVGDINLDHGERIGITGLAVNTMRTQNIGDVQTKSEDYIMYDKTTRSELAVPIRNGNDVVGVINLEHPERNAFNREDEQAIEYLAALSYVAIKSAKHFEEIQYNNRLREGLQQIGNEILKQIQPQRILHNVVTRIREILNCDVVTLYTYDSLSKQIGFPPIHSPGLRSHQALNQLKYVDPDSVVGLLLRSGNARFADDAQHDTYMNRGKFVRREGIQSSAGIPLFTDEKPVGIIFVNYRRPHQFLQQEREVLKLFATQVGIAFQNAQSRKRLETVAKISHLAATAVDVDLFLEHICRELEKEIKPSTVASVLMLDESGRNFSYYPRGSSSYLNKIDIPGEKVRKGQRLDEGICGWVATHRKTVNIGNVREDKRYLALISWINSELCVPILYGQAGDEKELVGVLDIENSDTNPFSDDEQKLAETLANQLAVMIHDSKQLKQTRQLVAARTSVAWVGMVSGVWRHSIEKHAVTITDQLQLLRRQLRKGGISNNEILGRISSIEKLAEHIRNKPITPPLTVEEGVESVPLNDLIRERVKQLWSAKPYMMVPIQLKLALEDKATVRASPEWLRRVLDILFDNAVEATHRLPNPKIIVASKRVRNHGEIHIIDNGNGIPDIVLSRLFQEQIVKPKGAKGLGLGLLFAQTIAQTYAGHVKVGKTDSSGTSMIVTMPLES